jgi:hypothetical protein
MSLKEKERERNRERERERRAFCDRLAVLSQVPIILIFQDFQTVEDILTTKIYDSMIMTEE